MDELNKPLGLRPERRPLPISAWRLAAMSAGALVIVAAAAWLALPRTSGPVVTAAIEAPPAPTEPTAAAEQVRLSDRTASITEVPAISEVEPTGSLTAVDEVVIHDGSDAMVQLAALPDSALVEESPDGPLPRVGEDGTRPLDAYARPDSGGTGTRIAIIVGGIGIDAETTRQAISELPGSVTLAFAPYGENLDADLANARRSGHEILLQLPLEPFNYPKTDPGRNTLTADAKPSENIRRLHWFLSRMTNYVGVVNYMGGRFTAEERAMKPVMDEIGTRGLLYVDDGSSPRSKAAAVAQGIAPFVGADIVLDADLSAAAIDAQLRRLAAIARQRGHAVATATAFPVTIERVRAFAAQAKSRGISIVPVSALAAARS